MRIIHTADWHVGVRLENYDRSYEHGSFFEFLFDYIATQERNHKPIEALLISGDLYNTFVPPMEQRLFLNRFLRRLLESFSDLSIYITSGNHDSGLLIDNMDMLCMHPRLHCLGTIPFISSNVVSDTEDNVNINVNAVSASASASCSVIDSCGTGLETASGETSFEETSLCLGDDAAAKSQEQQEEHKPQEQSAAHTHRKVNLDRMLAPLKDKTGTIYGYLALIPFIREGAIGRGALFADDLLHTASECTSELCHRLALRIDELKKEHSCPQAVSLAMAHLALSDKKMSDSSHIAGGGLAGICSDTVDYFDYTALGHYHLRSSSGCSKKELLNEEAAVKRAPGGRVCYSGSPFPITFAETNYVHSFTVLDITGDGTISREEIDIPRMVPMIRIPENGSSSHGCTVQEAREQIQKLPNEPLPLDQRPFVTIYLRSDSLAGQSGAARTDTAAELRKIFPENCRLCSVRTAEVARAGVIKHEELRDLESMTPKDVFEMFVRKKQGTDEVPQDLMDLFNNIALSAKHELDGVVSEEASR